MIVNFVRLHSAAPGVTVTESKMLLDSHLGIETEVDVVIEGIFDGDPVVTSIEVVEHKRPIDITWIRQMVRKHQFLPTNHLLLISKSGFTKTAWDAVAKEGGRVQALTPVFAEVDGKPMLESVYTDKLLVTPTICEMKILRPDGTVIDHTFTPDHSIYSDAGIELGSLGELAAEALRLKWLVDYLLQRAHHSPRRSEIKGFDIEIPVATLGYHLRDVSTNELHRILHLRVAGESSFEQEEVTLAMAQLGERPYAFAETVVFGKDVVVVATQEVETKKSSFSIRTIDGSSLVDGATVYPANVVHFPGLNELPIPTDDQIVYRGDV